ncbi:uncharacterized protein FOMMEDRAFT_162654 [Fomitiporia mediterranea MF3/22]|uniref:Uncharacterized protein n=1 Tax=Fomitiporia mediterranea (strain MF3/22) TaxID=694068 RepID=R7SFY8_FOMME|nr:uncharacterized protein FOMMEDRAFT_162654 [Fomitiporia mediterranea MF3/22]EJC97631.1 hypothetical protein FOMMEDRAFT_162654 [Fomitiporia mediterranea MF3/22]
MVTATTVHKPHDVSRTLNCFTPTDGALYNHLWYFDSPEDKPKSNVGHELHPAIIRFQSSDTEFIEEERVKNVYDKVMQGLIKATSTNRVFISDHITIANTISQLVRKRRNADQHCLYMSTKHARPPSRACTITLVWTQNILSKAESASSTFDV